MRLRSGLPLALAALLAAGCVTAPPSTTPSTPPPTPSPATPVPPEPPPTVVEQATSSYRSAEDAPRILETLDRELAGDMVLDALPTADLSIYSHLLLTAGRWAEAEQALAVLETKTPSDPEVLRALTLLAGARGDLVSQEARLAALEKVSPGDPDAADIRARLLLSKGDRVGAKAAWTLALTKAENPGALTGLARLALEAKRPQEAQGWADRAVKATPGDDQVWALRARILSDLGRYSEARRDLNRAIELAPKDPWHRLDRGKLAFLHLYDVTTAQADLEFVTIKDPDNFFGWEALAEVYEELERPRQAWDAWMKALSLRPDYRFAYPSAAMLAFRYQDWERAASYAREAAKAHPAEYAFPFVEALSLRALGKLQASQQVLEKARPRFTRGSTVDELFRFLLTPGSDYYLNTALNLEKQEAVRLRLRFYQGCFYALTKSASSARAAFEEVKDSTLKKIPEISAAEDWLNHGI